MKKCILLLLSLILCCSLNSQETIKMVYYNEYAPFSFEDKGVIHGILVDINEEIMHKRLGYTLINEGYPWVRAQEMVKNGTADGFVTVPTPERLGYSKASQVPSIITKVSPYVKIGNINKFKNIKKLSDTKPFRHGSYLGHGWAKKNLVDFNIDWAPKLENVLNMLANENQRIDMFIDVRQVVDYNLKELKLDKELECLPVIFDSSTFNICLGNNSKFQNLLPKIENELRKMKKDGTLKKIYQKY